MWRKKMSEISDAASRIPRVSVSPTDPTSTVETDGKIVYSVESNKLFVFKTNGGNYGLGSWIETGGGSTDLSDYNSTNGVQITDTSDDSIGINITEDAGGGITLSDSTDGIGLVQAGSGNIILLVNGTGFINLNAMVLLKSVTFSQLPVSPVVGMITHISDATVDTWSTAITEGGGTNPVLAWFNGTNWTVAGK